jgi:alpha-ketoglutarate-dependent taurine dioxygenase
MNLEQGRAILDEMQAWAKQPQFVYRHEWTVGDLLIWDNTGLIRQRSRCSVGRRWRRADRLSQTAARYRKEAMTIASTAPASPGEL